MVKKLIITKKDLNENNEYKEDSIDFDGAVIFEKGLGTVKIRRDLRASAWIEAKTGSGIIVGNEIKAGWGIEIGYGIEAGDGIEAGGEIKAGCGIKAGYGIEAGDGIKAGWGIKAGDGIIVGYGIKAGCGIEAGSGIITKFYGGLKAEFVSCLRIAVGFNINEEQVIETEIRKGNVLLGKVINPKKEKLEDLSKEELIKRIKEVEGKE